MIGTLSKLGSITDVLGPNPLRTKSIRGGFDIEPKVGWSFGISNTDPLDRSGGASMRYVSTSEVKEIVEHKDNRIVFHTENSVYELIID